MHTRRERTAASLAPRNAWGEEEKSPTRFSAKPPQNRFLLPVVVVAAVAVLLLLLWLPPLLSRVAAVVAAAVNQGVSVCVCVGKTIAHSRPSLSPIGLGASFVTPLLGRFNPLFWLRARRC